MSELQNIIFKKTTGDIPSFLDLVKDYFKNDTEFNIEKYLDHYNNDYTFEDHKLNDILPSCNLLISYSDILRESNKDYSPTEMITKDVRIYEYKEYYIIYSYEMFQKIFKNIEEYWDDNSFNKEYKNLERFYCDHVDVYRKIDFKLNGGYQEFLRHYKIKDLNFLYKLFKILFMYQGLNFFMRHIEENEDDNKDEKVYIAVTYKQIKKFSIDIIPGLPKNWTWDGHATGTDYNENYIYSNDDYYGPDETREEALKSITNYYIKLKEDAYLSDLVIE